MARSERYEFDSFVLDASQRLLLDGGTRVPLREKVFDTLLFLVRNAGRLVTKTELMEAIWPDAHVEESNLNHNISVLRKALRDTRDDRRVIETISKRGYRFLSPVALVDADPAADADAPRAEIPPPADAPSTGSIRGRVVLQLGAVALLLVALACIGVLASRTPPTGIQQIRSVAVLPFRTLNGADRSGFLELGLADALIDRLGYTRRFVVRPTSSIRRYAGGLTDAITAGKELDVDAVVEGNIQRMGDRIRVSVQVVSIAEKGPIWSSRFDERTDDLFALEDLISGAVARAIADSPVAVSPSRRSPDHRAYDSFIKARYYWNRRNPADLEKARALFEEAVRTDDSYAAAWAGLADSYILLALHRTIPAADAFPRAKAAAERALELEPDLAPAHASLGACSFYFDRDRLNAERHFRRALALQPSYATARQWYANYLAASGRTDEALEQLRRAEEVDPLSTMIRSAAGWDLFLARRYDEAASQLRRTLDLDNDFVPALQSLALVSEQKRKYGEAMTLLDRQTRLSGNAAFSLPVQARLAALTGDAAGARRILGTIEPLVAQRRIMQYDLATVYAATGDVRAATLALQRSAEARESAIVWLDVDPRLDSVRGDREFRQLAARLAW